MGGPGSAGGDHGQGRAGAELEPTEEHRDVHHREVQHRTCRTTTRTDRQVNNTYRQTGQCLQEVQHRTCRTTTHTDRQVSVYRKFNTGPAGQQHIQTDRSVFTGSSTPDLQDNNTYRQTGQCLQEVQHRTCRTTTRTDRQVSVYRKFNTGPAGQQHVQTDRQTGQCYLQDNNTYRQTDRQVSLYRQVNTGPAGQQHIQTDRQTGQCYLQDNNTYRQTDRQVSVTCRTTTHTDR